jgi:DNA-binding CsgD family transcriptional regulator
MPTPPAHWAAPGQPVFVGRRSERAVLDRAWREAQPGVLRLVLVCGGAGSGKSRLVCDAANTFHRQGAAVLAGGCNADFARPFDPVAEPVRVLLPWTAQGQIQLGDEVAAQADVVDRLRVVAGGESGGPLPSTRLLFDAVSRLIVAATAPRPLVVVLEDLHWAAESGSRLVVHLAEAVTDVPLLVLATLRTTGSTSDDPPALAGLYRLPGVHRLDLEALQTEDVADYLQRGHSVPPSVATASAPALREQTGGNPFLLREVCRSWPTDGRPGKVTPAPASVQATVLARCADLGPGSLEVLRLAAVLGHQVSAVELGWCLAEPDQSDDIPGAADATSVGGGVDASAAQAPDLTADRARGGGLAGVGSRALSGIDAAIGAGLLEKVPARDGAYRFLHALTRQSVLGAVPELDVARLHARVAVALEARLPTGPDAALRLAHYYLGATDLGYVGAATRHLQSAAADAENRSAFADAAALFERAASLTWGPERDGLHLDAARCHLRAGRFARARELNEGVARGAADPVVRVRAATAYEEASWRSGEPGQGSVDLLSETLAADVEGAELGAADGSHVLAIASLARAQAYAADPASANRSIEHALALARPLGNREVLAEVLERGLQLDMRPRALQRRLALADELVAVLPDNAELATHGAAASRRCMDAYIAGDPVSLRHARTDVARVARVTTEPVWAWTLSMHTYARDLAVGDLTAAAAAAEASREYAEGFEDVDRSSGVWGLQIYLVQRELDALEAARPILANTVATAGFWPPAALALATELGMTDLVARLTDQILGDDLDKAELSATWPAVLAFLGDAVAMLGDTRRARSLLPRARAYAGLNLLGAEFVAPLGSADRTIGQIESILGLAGAEESFDAALAMDRHMNAPLHEATTMAEHAAHRRRRGAPPTDVEAVAGPARELARSRAWPRILRRVGPAPDESGSALGAAPGEAEAATLDGEPAGTPWSAGVPAGPPAVTAPLALIDPLTSREVQVLTLVAQGLRNRDIARTLVISEYTAANHVRSILMKTGSANRTQAARFATIHALIDEGAPPVVSGRPSTPPR